MRNFWLSTLVVVCGICCANASNSQTRLEKNYDFDGAGESYTLKTYVNGSYRTICWEEYWSYGPNGRFWEDVMSPWCEPFFHTFGSTYTGTDEPGEVSVRLECNERTTDPGDCTVLSATFWHNCTGNVQVQCMDPMSDFDRAQPLSGILLGVCIALAVLLVISWIGCCCIGCNKQSPPTSKSAATVHAQPQQNVYSMSPQQQQQNGYPQQQTYYPAYAPAQQKPQQPAQQPALQQPQPGYMQPPPPQNLYPPPQPTQPAPTNPANAPPPNYEAATVEKL